MEFSKGKGFCVFSNDVVCSFRKSDRLGVMDRCLKCSHYLRFLREMAEEDEKVMDEIDRERKWRDRVGR